MFIIEHVHGALVTLTVLGGAVSEHHPQVAAAHVLDGNRHLERTTEKSGNERGGVNTGLNIREGGEICSQIHISCTFRPIPHRED